VGVVAALVAIGLASDDSGSNERADRTQTTPTQTEPEPAQEPPPPRRVAVRVAPVTPTYVCVDRGPRTEVLFEDTIDAPRTWRGRRVRLLLGKRDVRITSNGEPVEVTPGPDPIGFALTPRRAREIPSDEGPCA
jgi:hypothetical protein